MKSDTKYAACIITTSIIKCSYILQCTLPRGNIAIINPYGRNSPWASDTTTRQATEIKLATNLKKYTIGYHPTVVI